jgi:hypothetical protein
MLMDDDTVRTRRKWSTRRMRNKINARGRGGKRNAKNKKEGCSNRKLDGVYGQCA